MRTKTDIVHWIEWIDNVHKFLYALIIVSTKTHLIFLFRFFFLLFLIVVIPRQVKYLLVGVRINVLNRDPIAMLKWRNWRKKMMGKKYIEITKTVFFHWDICKLSENECSQSDVKENIVLRQHAKDSASHSRPLYKIIDWRLTNNCFFFLQLWGHSIFRHFNITIQFGFT